MALAGVERIRSLPIPTDKEPNISIESGSGWQLSLPEGRAWEAVRGQNPQPYCFYDPKSVIPELFLTSDELIKVMSVKRRVEIEKDGTVTGVRTVGKDSILPFSYDPEFSTNIAFELAERRGKHQIVAGIWQPIRKNSIVLAKKQEIELPPFKGDSTKALVGFRSSQGKEVLALLMAVPLQKMPYFTLTQVRPK